MAKLTNISEDFFESRQWQATYDIDYRPTVMTETVLLIALCHTNLRRQSRTTIII